MWKRPGAVTDSNLQWLDDVARGAGTDLLRFLRSRLSNQSDAEDLAQEVYMRLLRIKNPRQIRNRRAYVLQVAANVAYEWRLLAPNRLQHSSEALEVLTNHSDPEHEALIGQQMETLEAALNSVSPKCRAVLLLHRRDRYTYQEIAARMGISVSMVKKYLTKGLTVCQKRLIEKGDKEDRHKEDRHKEDKQ